MVNAEISRLMMELFNRMNTNQKMDIGETDAQKVSDFMVKNGYRFVFGRWHLQAEPDSQRQP